MSVAAESTKVLTTDRMMSNSSYKQLLTSYFRQITEIGSSSSKIVLLILYGIPLGHTVFGNSTNK